MHNIVSFSTILIANFILFPTSNYPGCYGYLVRGAPRTKEERKWLQVFRQVKNFFPGRGKFSVLSYLGTRFYQQSMFACAPIAYFLGPPHGHIWLPCTIQSPHESCHSSPLSENQPKAKLRNNKCIL